MDNGVRVDTNFLDYLGILFIALKLTGYINWSWVWVLSPIWFQFILFIILIILKRNKEDNMHVSRNK